MKHFVFALCVLIYIPLAAQKVDTKDEAALLRRSEKALTRVIVHDIFSPPVASRIYLYASMAAYETIALSGTEAKSLSFSLKGFPSISVNDKEPINFQVATICAFLKTAERFVFSEQSIRDSMHAILKTIKKVRPDVYQRSIALGVRVSDSIVRWAAGDHYKETRKLRRYSLIKENGKWLPTPPGYMSAVEPYWAMMRTVALDSAAECRPVAPPEYSTDTKSAFYKEAYEVYMAGNLLTPEQKAIAAFWDCNPFFLNTQGHLNFATKKLSPGGHWMSIAGIAAAKSRADLMTTAAAYMYTAIALYDGFISCWEEKFRSNLIRPETYINATIDEKWRPVLQTPPFPEYTSGHSVISNAAAIVLTHFFGENFSFDDVTETEFGLPVRSFTSFEHAAEEAAISRLYGGIHYRAAIQNGTEQGRRIGKKVIEKINITQPSSSAKK
jgi:hypothetical protein